MNASPEPPTRFCLDTGAFIEPWHKRYPKDMFPLYWERMDELAQEGIILAPQEVLTELSKIDDDLYAWAKARPYVFRPIDDRVQAAMRSIMKRFDRLVDTKKGRSIADPWVVAQAQVCQAVVVTEEAPGGGKSPKIPDVCEALGIPWTNLLEFMRQVKMTFR